MHMHAVGTPLL